MPPRAAAAAIANHLARLLARQRAMASPVQPLMPPAPSPPPAYASDREKGLAASAELKRAPGPGPSPSPSPSPGLADDVPQGHDATHRRLKSRHIQLIGIGGTIGTALFVRAARVPPPRPQAR